MVLEEQADGESCVGRDVLNSRMSTTADCTWHNTVPLISLHIKSTNTMFNPENWFEFDIIS